MASRRSKQQRGGRGGGDPGPEITKEEYAVAKFMRNNVPTKTTTLCGMRVEYFVGSKAVDALLASQWGDKCKKKESKLFESREDAVAYCQQLLDKKELFHRARKIVQNKKDDEDEVSPIEEKPRRRKNNKKDATAGETAPGGVDSAAESSSALRNRKKDRKKDSPTATSTTNANVEDPQTEDDTAATSKKGEKNGKKKKEEELAEEGEGTPVVKEKKKKRIKLDMHDDQTFIDGNDAYVWIYDPIRPTTFIFGLALVVGAIAVCLFPLWPEWMRIGAYYLSLTAAGLLGVILALSVFRYILYAFLWLATLGKVSFFLLPNLTEDVSFFESFVPVYELETNWGSETDESEKKKKKKKKKAKDSDNEGEDATEDLADLDDGRKSPRLSPSVHEECPPTVPVTDNEISQGEDNDDHDEDGCDVPDAEEDEGDPPSRASSSPGSDADYEIINHGDLTNGEKCSST